MWVKMVLAVRMLEKMLHCSSDVREDYVEGKDYRGRQRGRILTASSQRGKYMSRLRICVGGITEMRGV